uniref:Uncharacterized protein n=1 Tax=Oryza punctata TaxID=4537 RepID=A0A0E0JXR7_ORYPU
MKKSRIGEVNREGQRFHSSAVCALGMPDKLHMRHASTRVPSVLRVPQQKPHNSQQPKRWRRQSAAAAASAVQS